MTLGERIKECRQNVGLSQEKVAELVGVSRQAVTKWETDLSAPNTDNLFKLAEIFKTTVDMLLNSNDDNKRSITEQIYHLYKIDEEKKNENRRHKTRKHLKIVLVLVLVIGIVSSIMYIHNLPVEYDAGACGGGYATYIFDKYRKELTDKFVNGMDDDSNISSVEAVRGTQVAEWEDRTLFLQFDIHYEDPTQGSVTKRVRFIGERTWFDTYDWSGAIIDGSAGSIE